MVLGHPKSPAKYIKIPLWIDIKCDQSYIQWRYFWNINSMQFITCASWCASAVYSLYLCGKKNSNLKNCFQIFKFFFIFTSRISYYCQRTVNSDSHCSWNFPSMFFLRWRVDQFIPKIAMFGGRWCIVYEDVYHQLWHIVNGNGFHWNHTIVFIELNVLFNNSVVCLRFQVDRLRPFSFFVLAYENVNINNIFLFFFSITRKQFSVLFNAKNGDVNFPCFNSFKSTTNEMLFSLSGKILTGADMLTSWKVSMY